LLFHFNAYQPLPLSSKLPLIRSQSDQQAIPLIACLIHKTEVVDFNYLMHTTMRRNSWSNLKCPFPGDEQEQDVVLGMLQKSSACLPAIEVVLKPSVAGKGLQVKLVGQKAY
jgi:hypothetical protein